MKDKFKYILRKIRKLVIEYVATNRLFLSYVIIATIGLLLIRNFTIGNVDELKVFAIDISMVLLFGAFGYLFKPKNQFKYYFILILIFTIMEVVNSIYYTFYYSFASFGELATVGQTETVMGSIYEKLKISDIIYVIFPFIFYFIHNKLIRTTYYNFISVVEKGKKMCLITVIVALCFFVYAAMNTTTKEFGRLGHRWNRLSIVEGFGLVFYQCNDLVQTLTPKLNSLFGYDEASQKFIEYFTNEENLKYKKDNKYTNILDGYNIVFVHMEGIETFLMNLKFNGIEATPNINKLAREGMFFTNFYPQISTGTSSDTEFTLLTSLMPAASGAIFTTYYNREYVTIPKLLKEKGYFTFSMHGNYASMWNRSNVHPKLGYDKMYFEESFIYDKNDIINLGINDKMFFEQAIPILENVEENNEKYMGTIITLSNHSPFKYLNKYGEYDMSTTYKECVENNCEEVTTNYLYNTSVGNYIMSSHYADEALGEFIGYINNSEYFNNTVFVLYGDHDAKLSKAEKNYYYNYDYKTGELKTEENPSYVDYDYYDHELNKKTPLILWTKNKELRSKLNGKVDYVMGMYDVMPTIGNMLGIKNEYAFGNDIFNIKNNNIVVFPNGNFVTDLIYYNNSTGQSKIIKDNAELNTDYISSLIAKTENILEVSNAIVVHDLIKLESENLKTIKEKGIIK
ncbi:MAG: hypothetical protein E7163_01790 [Firmicutes bacterium]|nr:hypothetical protein [Bacillota bacterium]